MPDETNELLRQILSTQRELLVSYQEEMQRTDEFRIKAMEAQNSAARKSMVVLAIMLLAVMTGALILIGRFSRG